jgi:hypothetical protein
VQNLRIIDAGYVNLHRILPGRISKLVEQINQDGLQWLQVPNQIN